MTETVRVAFRARERAHAIFSKARSEAKVQAKAGDRSKGR